MKKQQELVLVRGIAGTGKSTFCRNNFKNHIWYEPDSLMKDCRGNYKYDSRTFPEAVKWCHTLTDTALSEDLDVIVSDVFLRLDDMLHYLKLTKHHDCQLKIITCTHYRGSTHRAPLWQIERMRDDWQDIPESHELFKYLMIMSEIN